MMNRRIAAAFLFLLGSAGLEAQSMNIPPSSAKPGTSGSLLLVINSPAGKAPLALQWKFTFPAGVTVDPKDVVAGGAAESPGKSLTCNASKKPAKSAQTFSCILAGGQEPIPNGTVCIVRYRVANSAKWGSGDVNVDDILAVGADLKKVPIANVQGHIATK
jgi:hypothetical protein